MASKPYDWDYNIEKATSMIREAANNGANICLLPEVFIPGYNYSTNNFRSAETLDGPTITTLLKQAKDLNVYISGGLIEKANKHFYNTMFFMGPDGLMGTYRKMFVFSMEQKYWKRGKEGMIIDTEFGTIGFGICADMHYPKLWRQYAGKVDLILICSAWPLSPEKYNFKYATHELELCQNLPIQISETFQVPTAYCNASHTSTDKAPFFGRMKCAGFSKIVDKSKVIASIESREEKVIQGIVETREERLNVELSVFKNWIKYQWREKLLKFFVERSVVGYARLYYWWKRKKFREAQFTG